MSKVLIIGPSGSGKTYVSAFLRGKGINAPDADLIEGLHGWFDGNGNKVNYPEDADKEFLDNHDFLWNRDFLKKYLKNQDEVYLFGMSGNTFDMIDLFDKVYFLKTSPEILRQQLRHESRENTMGKTDYQLESAIRWGQKIEAEADKLGVEMIDATQTPEQIFDEIKK